MRTTIGVLGSATSDLTKSVVRKVRELGREIAVNNCAVLVGVSEGVLREAVRGAKEAGGLTIGFSPAMNMSDHIRNYKLPFDNLGLVVFTGFGFKGRNVVLVQTCEAVVIVSGRIGTLNEFTIASDENKVIGVLEHTEGVSDLVRGILGSIEKRGGVVIYDSEPKKLVGEMLRELRNRRL